MLVALPLLVHSESTGVALGMVPNIIDSTVPITAATCICTGTVGYVAGIPLLNYLGFNKDQISCRALAIGTSSSALGVAALRLNGEEAASGLSAVAYMTYQVWMTAIIMSNNLFQGLICKNP